MNENEFELFYNECIYWKGYVWGHEHDCINSDNNNGYGYCILEKCPLLNGAGQKVESRELENGD